MCSERLVQQLVNSKTNTVFSILLYLYIKCSQSPAARRWLHCADIDNLGYQSQFVRLLRLGQ